MYHYKEEKNMYCKNCGKEIAEGRVYCDECAPQEVHVEEQPVKHVDSSKGKGIAALICGALSLWNAGTGIIGLVLAIVAMVLGGQAANTAGAKLGKVGKTLGVVSLILSILLTVLYVVGFVGYFALILLGVGAGAMEELYYY